MHEEEQPMVAVVVIISRHPVRREPNGINKCKQARLSHAGARGAVTLAETSNCERAVWFDAGVCEYVKVQMLALGQESSQHIGLKWQRSDQVGNIRLVCRRLYALPPASIGDILQSLWPRMLVGDIGQCVLVGDFGSRGEGNALQALDRVGSLRCIDVAVACHQRLTVATCQIQVNVYRRTSGGDVIVLEITRRAGGTRAGDARTVETRASEQVALLPSASKASAIAQEPDEHGWAESKDFIAAWPLGQVPWQYTDMLRGPPFTRAINGSRVAMALRMLEQARAQALARIHHSHGADMPVDVALTENKFSLIGGWLQREGIRIWEHDDPGRAW
ncbi:hypothetical protein N9L19_01115 [bacterium]|nr:hypothetical protein [bacterium]